jgi:hypothetical protein
MVRWYGRGVERRKALMYRDVIVLAVRRVLEVMAVVVVFKGAKIFES